MACPTWLYPEHAGGHAADCKPAGTVQWVVSSWAADMDRPAMADQASRSSPSLAFRRSQIRRASSSVSPTNAVGT